MLGEMKKAFRDSIFIAYRAYHHSNRHLDVFKRYFRDTEADQYFVREVFKDMFRPDMVGPSPLFSKMTIWLGSKPNAHFDYCEDLDILSYTEQDPHHPENNVDLIVCAQGMVLGVLEDKSCNFLSDHVDDTFLTLGGDLIHEYVHWAALVRSALKLKHPEPLYIGDWLGPDPADGYGPYNVLKVREKHDPLDNADSFRWFATEAYFHQTCRPSGPQYGPGREPEPLCDFQGNIRPGRHCHPL